MGFDPTGLERAAKAARELNQSREVLYKNNYELNGVICTQSCLSSMFRKELLTTVTILFMPKLYTSTSS